MSAVPQSGNRTKAVSPNRGQLPTKSRPTSALARTNPRTNRAPGLKPEPHVNHILDIPHNWNNAESVKYNVLEQQVANQAVPVVP